MTAAALPAAPYQHSVGLRRAEDGPEVTREPVSDVDQAEARSEAWLHCALRRGLPDLPFDDFAPRLVPLFKKDGGPGCTGFALEADAPGGAAVRCAFSVLSADRAAARAARRLVAAGSLEADAAYYFQLTAARRPALPAPCAAGDPGKLIDVTSRPQPLAYGKVPLAPLLERATTVGDLDERSYHVFFTAAALAAAERCSRKGAAHQPPVETGAVLIGPLCWCRESGEFFAVVLDVLEVHDAEGTEFSLTYSGASWARIQAVLKARQARAATRAHRILGQCHGHNFLPAGGAPPCEVCHQLKECSRTSAFVSAEDLTWTRAVFSRQPWQLCHIFGLNARGEPVQRLFGLRDGRLLERGYHVLPEFA
jgi:hypothetical protein